MTKPDNPAPEADNLDWDVLKHGRMRDYATKPADEPETVPYEDDEPGKHAAPEVE